MTDKKEYKTILKTLVGSRAHGLSNPDSDYDYRGVFLVPTKELLKVDVSKKIKTDWQEGDTKEAADNTQWELGHFLMLATKCNPTILEVFRAPVITKESTDLGASLRKLFPRVWNSRGVMKAFMGYGCNQRKKFLNKDDARPHKYATAYLRTLIQAWYLLTSGELIVDMSGRADFETLQRFKAGKYEFAEVMGETHRWEDRVIEAYDHNPDKETDIDQVNAWLLKVRKSHWE